MVLTDTVLVDSGPFGEEMIVAFQDVINTNLFDLKSSLLSFCEEASDYCRNAFLSKTVGVAQTMLVYCVYAGTC